MAVPRCSSSLLQRGRPRPGPAPPPRALTLWVLSPLPPAGREGLLDGWQRGRGPRRPCAIVPTHTPTVLTVLKGEKGEG